MESTTSQNKHLFPIEPSGVVISGGEANLPNISEFAFILSNLEDAFVRQGQYSVVKSPEGLVIGQIEQIYIYNEYFQNIQTVKSFDQASVNLKQYFPSDQWECHVAKVHVLGVIPCNQPYSIDIPSEIFRRIDRAGFPVKPGNKVYLLQGEHLRMFLGIEAEGLNIGKMKYQKIDVRLNIDRLFNKHLAILAQSGAGKSYLISVLLEELLQRDFVVGTPGILLMDVHGEYRFLKQNLADCDSLDADLREKLQKIQSKIEIYQASFLQIGVPDLSEYDFVRYQPGITHVQLRILRNAIQTCKRKMRKDLRSLKSKEKKSKTKIIEKIKLTAESHEEMEPEADKVAVVEPSEISMADGYDIKNIIKVIESTDDGNSKSKETLINWLLDLDYLKLFGKHTSPFSRDLIKMGRLSIIDFSNMISMRKKQILIHFFSSHLFSQRRQNHICPFILFLEEAHNFLPETSSKSAIAKPILETIAREGRKFFAQLVLVSQRPVRLSTTVLSQCNTQIIMRITNPYDLKHIKETSESLTSESVRIISNLPTGNALILGVALNYPVYLQVRLRNFPNLAGEIGLTEVSKRFYSPSKKNLSLISDSCISSNSKSYSLVKFMQEDFIEPDLFDLQE